MLEPVNISERFKTKYYEKLNIDKFRLKDMRADPTKFAKFMLGFVPRDYQSYLMDNISNEQKLSIVKGRQIGFSTTIALYCLWSAWFKKCKTGANRNTKICVISKDDDAAKKLLQQIKDFMYQGDRHMSAFLKGRPEHTTNVFSKEIIKSNVDELTLKNGSRIYSFPPTGKVRGTSNDILFIDEFAFLNNPNVQGFYYTDALPSLTETRGKLIVSSTPNGYGNLFHKLIDPEDRKDFHEGMRLMFPFTVNHDNENYLIEVEKFRRELDEKQFAQEYLCDFTQSDISFFDSVRVQAMFDNNVMELDLDAHEWIASIDYGMTESRTVITLCTFIDGIIYRGYYKEFESGWDTNGVIPFMTGLKDRFKINKIVVDDCPQGNTINNKMVELGWNIDLFDFHTKKIEAYNSFKNKMNKGEIKMVPDETTELQFLEMQQEESKMGKLLVHKPTGGRDDIVDGMIMASYHFLETVKRIGAYYV